MSNKPRSTIWPAWFDGTNINEALYSAEFLKTHSIIYTEGAFFTPDGCMHDEIPLKEEIFRGIEPYASTGVPKKIQNIIDVLAIKAYQPEFPPEEDCIHLKNGTLHLDGSFDEDLTRIVRSRLPVNYNPDAKKPEVFLGYLDGLLYPEDIPTFQEFAGYCLIPTNKAQRMMIIKGSGGEGKSQAGTVLKKLFGENAKDGSVGKVSENRFARADLEHIHLMIDDDMRMEALRQTNYVKSLVTATGKMDLEKKGRQSYQGYMYARLLAFSNGDLQSLYDRSDGFYRRQLILTTREKDPNRVDDPELANKMCAELEGIFLWAFEGLKRLAANGFRFTESERAQKNRDVLKQDANNGILFMESQDYIKLGVDSTVSSKELYAVYCMWCDENGFQPMKPRSFADYLTVNAAKFGIEHMNNVYNADHRRVWGFRGMKILVDPGIVGRNGYKPVYDTDELPFK